MSDRVFIDTNVLVYLFDAGEPKKRALADEVLQRESKTSELVVSTQVLQELYVALTRGKEPIASADVARQAVEAASNYSVVQVDVDLVLSGITVSRNVRLSFWDGLIMASAASSGCARILTEDLNDDQVINGVRVENPFV